MACEGGHFTMFPTLCVEIFGIQNGGQIYTFLFFFIPFSAITGFILNEFGKKFISSQIVYFIAGGLTCLNFVLLYFFDEKKIRKNN